jgi:uncharacterized protein
MDTDHDPYVEGLRSGELRLQQCTSCGAVQFYPRAYCASCRSVDLRWLPASGQGTVYSFTIVRRAPSKALAEHAPYLLAVVELAEGPHVMANLVGCAPEDVRIEQPVRLEFASWSDEDPRPVFRPVS